MRGLIDVDVADVTFDGVRFTGTMLSEHIEGRGIQENSDLPYSMFTFVGTIDRGQYAGMNILVAVYDCDGSGILFS